MSGPSKAGSELPALRYQEATSFPRPTARRGGLALHAGNEHIFSSGRLEAARLGDGVVRRDGKKVLLI